MVMLFQNSIIDLSNMAEQINSILQLLQFFKSTERCLFYIGPIYGSSLLNLNHYMPNFQMITCNDPYFGALPFIKVPQSFKDTHKQCIVGTYCQNNILRDPSIVAYMKSKDPNPNVIFMLVDAQTEELCQQNGLTNWGCTAQLYNFLGNKVKMIDLLLKANIPFIPNVRSKIDNYQHLLALTSRFSTKKIVIQDQNGVGGYGTMYVQSQDDYKANQAELQNGKDFKIMPYRRLKCFAIGAVATKTGTIIGPLQSELIGHEQLAPYWAGYCGNQIRSSYFQDSQVEAKVRKAIAEYTIAFGNFLYKQGLFRGLFGFDFAVDLDTNEVFFMEMNPRMTGSTTLAFQIYKAQGCTFPIILYHCLQFLGVQIKLDIQELNNQWITLQHYQQELSHIIMRPLNSTEVNIPYSFPAGFWQLEGEALKHTGIIDFRFSEMGQDCIFFSPNRGFSKGNIVIKRRCQDYNFKLTQETKQLIDKFITLRLTGTPP